jgi:hypothetical protein
MTMAPGPLTRLSMWFPRICAAIPSNGTINSDFSAVWRGQDSESKRGWGSSKEVVRLRASTPPRVGHRFFEGFAVKRCALANCSRNPALALAHPTAQWTCWSLWMLSTSPFRGKKPRD